MKKESSRTPKRRWENAGYFPLTLIQMITGLWKKRNLRYLYLSTVYTTLQYIDSICFVPTFDTGFWFRNNRRGETRWSGCNPTRIETSSTRISWYSCVQITQSIKDPPSRYGLITYIHPYNLRQIDLHILSIPIALLQRMKVEGEVVLTSGYYRCADVSAPRSSNLDPELWQR